MSGRAKAAAGRAQASAGLAAEASPDAALLALAARWRAVVAQMDALEAEREPEGDARAREARLSRLVGSRAAAERRVARMPARTLPGLRAKAEVAMRSADISGWGEVGPGDSAYVAYWLCRDVVTFAGGDAELRAALAARRRARQQFERRVAAAQQAAIPAKAEREQRLQEEGERMAALGLRARAWSGGHVDMAVCALRQLCQAGHVQAARGLLDAIGPDLVDWWMPAELKASLGLVTRH